MIATLPLDIMLDLVPIIKRINSGGYVETTFEIIKQELEKGNKVSISGFGKWTTRDKKPRRGRNPKTGQEIIISGRRVVSFHSSNILKTPLRRKGDINGNQEKIGSGRVLLYD